MHSYTSFLSNFSMFGLLKPSFPTQMIIIMKVVSLSCFHLAGELFCILLKCLTGFRERIDRALLK